MKVPFLLVTFAALILTARAQRTVSQYTCHAEHKHHDVVFYLMLSEVKSFTLGGHKLFAGVNRTDGLVELWLKRVVTVLDATYQKEARRSYPAAARQLAVALAHQFGGREDVFTMSCVPRDP
jgi:hypothetical protein